MKTSIIVESGNDSCCRGHPLEVEPLIIVEKGFDFWTKTWIILESGDDSRDIGHCDEI